MMSGRDADFSESLGCLVADASARLAARLADVPGLSADERGVIHRSVHDTTVASLHGRLCRVLLLELHAAVEDGLLAATDSAARWHEFIALSSTPAFWQGLDEHYPTMADRVRTLVDARFDRGWELARRFAVDRGALTALVDTPLGELVGLELGAGDSHAGGQTVALLRCEHGRVVYKPRSVAIDVELRRFIEDLGIATSMRVPAALEREGYGWTAFIEHRYAADAAELRSFYRGTGEWLALMRLLGGTDLHAENLIAHGPYPFVIDCETLFTPRVEAKPSGMGAAHDRAVAMIDGTVLAMGMLPGRGGGLGWRGVDTSGIGALPGEQPKVSISAIVDGGTDRAHLGTVSVDVERARNHPGEQPELSRYWGDVLAGFDALTAALQDLDARDDLAARLLAFDRCLVRVVLRATETYAELARMLWHPVSLHDAGTAITHAASLLRKSGHTRALSPDDDAVIDGEIADLLDGDIPYFSTLVSDGRLDGPRGTHWLEPKRLVDEALAHWRNADLGLERQVIHAALASAYAGDGWTVAERSLRVVEPRREDRDSRRRSLAASIVGSLASRAIRGADGSAAWIASVLGPNGRSVQPLAQDLYGGLSGLALLTAAYTAEMAAGRANEVEGVAQLRDGIIHAMRLTQAELFVRRARVARPRPTPPGGYIGLGSQIWTWLTLDELGVTQGEGVERARELAALMPESVDADDVDDLLTGSAGGIVPMLRLCRASGDATYLDIASRVGDRLCDRARVQDGKACWPHERWTEGLGGFGHGVTGIGWALHKLAAATGQARHLAMAEAAFAFEDALFDKVEGNWRDLRGVGTEKFSVAWCHGAMGIGLAWVDLGLTHGVRQQVLRQAVQGLWRKGMGINHHGLCHGDLGSWELLDHALKGGWAPEDMSREALEAGIVGSLETHGAYCGMVGEALSPGLMAGVGGIAYQLLRMDPRCALPSVLSPTDRWRGQSSTRSTHSDSVPSEPPMSVAAATSLG